MSNTHRVVMTKDGSKKIFKMVRGIEGGKLHGRWRRQDEVIEKMAEAIKLGWRVETK